MSKNEFYAADDFSKYMNPPDTTDYDSAKKDIMDNLDNAICRLIEGNTVVIYPPTKKGIKITFHKAKKIL